MVDESDKSTAKAVAYRIGRIVLSVGFLVAALWLLDTDSLLEALDKVQPEYLAVALGLLLLEAPVLGFRWYLLVRREVDLSAYEVMRRYAIALFFSTFTPAQLGTDIYRFADLRAAGAARRPLLAMLVQERVLGLLSYLLFFSVCVIVILFGDKADSGDAQVLIFTVLGIFALTCIGVLTGPPTARALRRLNARTVNIVIADKLLDVGETALAFGSIGHVSRILGLSLLGGSALWVVTVFVIADALDVGASFALIGLIAVVVEIIRLVPLTVQGLGIREASFAYGFQVFGLSAELGFVVGLVAYITYNVAVILIGVVGYCLPNRASH